MDGRILVAYASNAGSTAGVAKAIGEELARDGAQVDVRPIAELAPADLSGYAAFVVGAPMILGWHRAAERFVKANRRALATAPVAFFATAVNLTRTAEGLPAGVPLYIDPKLGKEPGNPRRLGFKERWALPGHYLEPILKSAGDVKPVSIAFFAGQIDFGRLKMLQMVFIMLIVGAQPGDYRNWDAIRAWARDLAPKLGRPGGAAG